MPSATINRKELIPMPPYIDVFIQPIRDSRAQTAIVVTPSSLGPSLYVKENGSWVAVAMAYRKVSGPWQQVALDQAFTSGTNYVRWN